MKRPVFEYYSYISIIIVFILLVLMLIKVIPLSLYYYVLGISIVLLAIRLIFRIYYVVQDRKSK